jgi:LPS export ABC transporter protein LptC
MDWIEKRKKIPISESYGVTYLYTEKGLSKAKLKMTYVKEISDNPQQGTDMIAENGVEIIFYDTLGKIESILKANTAKLTQHRSHAVFSNNVILTNQKGDKLETEKLEWDRALNKIYTQSFVKITTAHEILMGEGMESDTDFKKYTIKKTRGTIQLTE